MASLMSVAQDKSTITAIREELFFTDFDIEKSHSFHDKLVKLKEIHPVFTAYEGAAKALIAKHSWNPITKIMSLKESLNLLDNAIGLDNMNIEIRFLRLYIENSIPSYLGMKDHLEDDKKTILNNLNLLETSELNMDIVKYIHDYMTTKVNCTPQELEILTAKF